MPSNRVRSTMPVRPLWLYLFLLVCAAVAPLIAAGLYLSHDYAEHERGRSLERVTEKARSLAFAIDRDLFDGTPQIPRSADLSPGFSLVYDLPEGWFAAVLDETLTIRARSHREADFLGKKPLPGFQDKLSGGGTGIVESVDLEGRPSVSAFFQSPVSGWTAVVWVPRSTLDVGFRQLTRAAILICGLGILLSGIAALLAARMIARPVDMALAAAQRLGEGRIPDAIATGVQEFDLLGSSLRQAGEEIAIRQAALKESRARARRIIDSIMDGFMVLDPEWRITFISARGSEILSPLGRRAESIVGRTIWEVFPEIVGTPLDEGFRRAMHGREMLNVEAPLSPLDMWFDVRAYPAAGDGLSVLFLDITERKRSEERLLLLMRELDHRAKNALAVVQSVVQLTRADTIAEFVSAVRGRVAALARTHALLAENRWTGASLAQVIADELRPYFERRSERLTIAGPPIDLVPEIVQSVGMVVHELATNAAKYGALSQPEGRIAVEWQWLEAGRLRVTWRETGGPETSAPQKRGFGSAMIERTVETQLGGYVTYHWLPEGLLCEFTVGDGLVNLGAPRQNPQEPTTIQPEIPVRRPRVLVVEDEPMIALGLTEDLERLGWTPVGPAGTVEHGVHLARTERDLEAAVLDVNLRGREVWPIADALRERGIPFLFATGYGHTLKPRTDAPVIEKPFAAEKLSALLHTLLRQPDPGKQEA